MNHIKGLFANDAGGCCEPSLSELTHSESKSASKVVPRRSWLV